MHTLLDVVSSVRQANEVRAPEGWPIGLQPKTLLRVPDYEHDHVLLPKQPEGLGAWREEHHLVAVPFSNEHAHEARAALLSRPTFVAPLPLPSDEWFRRQQIDRSRWKRESPVYILSAVAFQMGRTVVYGISRTLVVEHLRGWGASEIVFHEESWITDGLDSFAEALANQVVDTTALRPLPEGTAAPWTTVMMLLNNEDSEPALPPGWKRVLELVAGLHAVRLEIYANAWSKKARVLHELRDHPPNALLVSDGSIAAPEAFLGPYRQWRPDGYGQLLSTKRSKDFAEHLVELGMHLREVVELEPSPVRASDDGPEDWETCKTAIEELEGDHFKLTQRARDQLKDNPYPKPARMYTHVKKLSEIAKLYHDNSGNLGRRLEEVARDHEIEIALFDSSVSANMVKSGDHEYSALPHVKVDDAVSPADCGRIYFALDNRKYLFIVDHIGLHDY